MGDFWDSIGGKYVINKNKKTKQKKDYILQLPNLHTKKTVVRCHEVGGNALTVCVLLGPRASSILVKGSANHLIIFIV